MTRSSIVPIAAALVLAACGESAAPPTIASVSFDADAVTIVRGDTVQRVATARDSRGGPMPAIVGYTAANPEVATVDPVGRIVGVGTGTTSITASVGEYRDELRVTVVMPTVRSVSLAVDSTALMLDEEFALVTVVTDDRGKVVDHPLTFTSSDVSVATVSEAGIATPVGAGRASITVSAGTATATMKLDVLPQFTQIATGGIVTCGISGRGVTNCWGSSAIGSTEAPRCEHLGLTCSLTPMRVGGAHRFATIAAGDWHACGIDESGKAWCWGENDSGALGNGTKARSVQPTPVAGDMSFVQLAAGRFHTCGITTSGDTYCWGWDPAGQLGAGEVAPERCIVVGGTHPCATNPVKVATTQRFVEVASSEKFTCARTAAGAVHCWGRWVGGGEMQECEGTMSEACTRVPRLQTGGTVYTDMEIGDSHRCVRRSDGAIECWGNNSFGQFGNGTDTGEWDTPVPAASGMSFTKFVAGATANCGITADHVVRCWGANVVGAVGDGSTVREVLAPTAIAGAMRFSGIWSSPNSGSFCGTTTSGQAWCWGWGDFGQLGDGRSASSNVPVRVAMPK